VAKSAQERGHSVTLISGPVSLVVPSGVKLINVVSAQDMLVAVREHLAQCDVLIMCAAVADWRPKAVAAVKIKKSNIQHSTFNVQRSTFNLELEPTSDILLAIKPLKKNQIFVGFAAETHDVLAEAQRKLEVKGLDLIVANNVSQSDAGFEVDTNRVTFLEPNKAPQELALMSKKEVGARIVEWCENFLSQRTQRYTEGDLKF